MNVTVRANLVDKSSGLPTAPVLVLDVFPNGNSCVIHARGELDLATRNQLFEASTQGNHSTMVIDLAEITFMDCSGYGCLVASRLIIEGNGRTLTISGQSGQPARLLEMIAALEQPVNPA